MATQIHERYHGFLIAGSTTDAIPSKEDRFLWGHEEPTPEEIQLQGMAVIKRVKSFFEEVDLSIDGVQKQGVLKIFTRDFPHGGYRIHRASVNGIQVAEMDVYDPTIGTFPYYRQNPEHTPVAKYTLDGKTGQDFNIPTYAYVLEHQMGLEITTSVGNRNMGKETTIRRTVGVTPEYYTNRRKGEKETFLTRPAELGALKDLGCDLRSPMQEARDAQLARSERILESLVK